MLGIRYTIKSTLYTDVLKVYAHQNGKLKKIAEINIGTKYTEDKVNKLLTSIVNMYDIDSYFVM